MPYRSVVYIVNAVKPLDSSLMEHMEHKKYLERLWKIHFFVAAEVTRLKSISDF